MPTLAITLGDPAGIGPEIVARALAESAFARTRLLVIGHLPTFMQALYRLRTPLKIHNVRSLEECTSDEINVWPVASELPVTPGQPSSDTGRAALAAIDVGLELALNRQVDALVTAPVSKRHIADAGIPFMGHTEYLAARCHVKQAVMFFVAQRIRVALVTTHLPIRKVPSALTVDRIVQTIAITAAALYDYFRIFEPQLAVSGLNPHAGEGGHVGREEIEVIGPAVQLARERGIHAVGPLPGDTLFRRVMAGQFDAAVAMFHDQALGPVKTHDHAATNVTLGLPFVRTSVDHGTAFDIAGRSIADAAPMAGAIRVALDMVEATALRI